MVKYSCERCGYSTEYKGHFRKHLLRKNTCKAKLQDIDIDLLREKYGYMESKCKVNGILENGKCKVNVFKCKSSTFDKKYECIYCDKIFSSKQGKYQHEKKYCKEKKKQNENQSKLLDMLQKKDEEMKTLLKQKDEEMKKKDEQIKAIMEHMEKLLEKVGNTTINQTNNIQLNSYGKENMKYLKDNTFIKLLEAPFNSIPKLVKKIHFNKKHPENQNIRITNKKLPYAEIYKDDKWVIRDKKETIMDLVEVKKGILDERYEELKDELMDYKQDNYEDYVDKRENEKWTKKIELKTELEILNGCR